MDYRKNRPKSQTDLEQAIIRERTEKLSPETKLLILKDRYRKRYGLTYYEMMEEPAEAIQEFELLMYYLDKKEEKENNKIKSSSNQIRSKAGTIKA